MSHPGWLCLGGMEIVNNQRTAAYAAHGWGPAGVTITPCYACGDELAAALGEPGGRYSNPGTDSAPWFSTTEPESIEFGGLLVTSVDGLGPGLFTRDSTPRASGRGSFVGPGTQASPVITVRGILVGRTCCSVDYGFRWLSNVLRGTCGAECEGDDLTFLDCCPEWCEDSPEFTSYADCMAPYLRTLKGVSVASAPRIVDRIGRACGCCAGCALMVIEFQLTAAEPCVFRTPVVVESGVLFDLVDVSDCPEWVPTPEGTDCNAGDCQPAADCMTDPLCPPAPKPPTPPAVLNACVCEPMGTVSACIDLPGAMIPEFTDAVPIVEIRSGSRELRQVRMQFQVNPLGLPPDQLNPCNACGEVTLSHIPADSVFRMDGTNQTVTITCPGSSPTDATPLLGSRGGRLPFRFPEIECGGVSYTMCVEADAATVADNASIALSVVVREC